MQYNLRVGDGPAVLQLHKWSHSQFQLELSEYCLASISPTRDLLLLLSYQCEALLLPLFSGKFYSEDLQEANSLKPAADRPELVNDARHVKKAEENLGGVAFPNRGSSSASDFYPVISDVKSLAWGHCGDAYNQFEGSAFREILIVSSDRGIIIHAFRDPKRNEAIEIAPEGEAVHGKWVDWGPSHSTDAKEKFSHSSACEDLNDGGAISEIPEGVNVQSADGDDCSSSRGILPKDWLCTFLTKLDTDIVVSSGKYLAKFPARTSIPPSADVVSFDISDHTLKFLKFLSCDIPYDKEDDSRDKTVVGQMGYASFYDLSTDVSAEASNRCIHYRCSRVFNSSSHCFIGLVLNFPQNSSAENSKADIANTEVVFVVVMKMNHWGLQWVCSVDLQNQFHCSGPSPEWADFQFSEDFLVCLNTSGLICIWGAKTGDLIARFDVLKSRGLDLNVWSGLDQSKLPVNRDSTPLTVNFSQKVAKNNEVNVGEMYAEEIVCTKFFRRLIVLPNSFLLAVVDEHGVIYVFGVAKYVSENFIDAYKYSNCGMLSGWNAAGCEIDSQKLDLSPLPGSYVPDFAIEASSSRSMTRFTQFKNRHHHIDGKETHPYTSSVFSTFPQTNGEKMSYPVSEIRSNPLRKVFLPLDRFSEKDSICFSPFGITRLVGSYHVKVQKSYKIVHTGLHVVSPVLDDRDLDLETRRVSEHCASTREVTFFGESIGCSFQGCLYLVTQDGISVVLPSVSVSSSVLPTESIRRWQPHTTEGGKKLVKLLTATDEFKDFGRSWQIEVLDRTLLYDGPVEAEQICLENGWDLKLARVRRMQLSLHYLKSDEIEKSLYMLADANLAEEGILHLLFTSVYRIFCKAGSDGEVALASRLLALAASFAIKTIRRYGLAERKQEISHVKKDIEISYARPLNKKRKFDGEISNSRRLCEMARYLEVIRNLQSLLSSKSHRLAGGTNATNDALQDDSFLSVSAINSVSCGPQDASEAAARDEQSLTGSELEYDDTRNLALSSIECSAEESSSHDFHEAGGMRRKKTISMENPNNMIARWAIDNIDLKAMVKDALASGRLPLAVLQLHLLRQKELTSGQDPHDTFSEISEIGKSIAYDLFLKGESGLAVETLIRLGEDVEVILRELLFGTVRRSLRKQIVEEINKYGNLRPHELRILERVFLIERHYPSSSFWGTFLERQKNISGDSSGFSLPNVDNLVMNFHVDDNLTIECGDIDGVVTGSWANVAGGTPEVCEDNPRIGYWVSAAIWSDAWDQRTVDRIVLDQHEADVAWESQLEYHMSHNDWEEVCKLLDMIPASLLSEGNLEINLDSSLISANTTFPDPAMYICAAEELEPVCMDIPDVKIFRSSAINTCSSWLRMLVEQELAKKYIFLKEYWEGTAEIMPLLARAGLIIDIDKVTDLGNSSLHSCDLAVSDQARKPHEEAAEALHKLVVRYCTHYNLPNLLDLYLDSCDLFLNDDSLSPLLDAAGDCQWAKWLLFSKIKGREYEASLANARSNMARQMILGSNLSILEIDEILLTVDDMAEGGGEMAALATLMYATAPIQKCLCAGSVNRHCSFSSQCTLENLRPGLQLFPTLWRTLVNACFGQDDNSYSSNSNAANVFGKSALSDYLNWRDAIFSSSGGDTSLIQMLPCWFPKTIRRLTTLFVQGPLGWQSLSGAASTGESSIYRESSFIINASINGGVSPVNWESAIQRSVEELYSSLEDKGFGVEHHLHRGRALAAFNHILGLRASKLKSSHVQKELTRQANIQSDMQAILSPLIPDEESILSSVVPLAIMHFEDSVLVASCSFLLELCGVPATLLRVDVAVLWRISSYYSSIRHNTLYGHVSPRGSAIHAVPHEGDIMLSIVQALADNYMHNDYHNILEQKHSSSKVPNGKQPSRSLMTVLQHLEKASLPLIDEGKTCGYWLSSGYGDGHEFRSHQKDASLHWKLVTEFCHMHQLPLSTKYLALLAADNDWVGFLTEAQVGGFSDDVIIDVAAKEFGDPRLKSHILTVLRSMQSVKKKASASTTNGLTSESHEISPIPSGNTVVPTELFGILAECERQTNPGEALLTKAKDLRWALLAMIASCFSDVPPLSCLTVWLEITAARETSSIKVNDISSKIAKNVGTAVEATNKLPSGCRSLVFRYNRRKPKRRCLMEPASGESKVDRSFNVPGNSSYRVVSFAQEIGTEERNEIINEKSKVSVDSDEGLTSLSNMIAVLCEQHLFLPLLRAFEMFLPSCSLLPFIRSLQAFSQMRLSEASAHLASFSTRVKEELFILHTNIGRDGLVKTSWISSTAVKAAEAILSTCASAYEKRCLLQLLAAVDFGDGGSASAYFRRLFWKINLAEPSLRKDEDAYLGDETLDDAALLTALEANGRWEQARNWARQLESSGASWKDAVHHVTEAQAEAMVVEWKEYLWDVPEERAALWGHCQTLFLRYSFPPLQAGLFFLKHAEAVEKEIPARELHEMLLLSLQWLSGTMTKSFPVYPLHLLREIETRVWLLAVESEAQSKSDGPYISPNSIQNMAAGNNASIIERTANIITKMDAHINAMRLKAPDRNGTRESNFSHGRHMYFGDSHASVTTTNSTRTKRRSKTYMQIRRPSDATENNNDSDDNLTSPHNIRSSGEVSKNMQMEENMKIEASVSGWEEKVRPAEVERAVLSLLEFGQITAAGQLQLKLSHACIPPQLLLVDAALKVAALSSSCSNGKINEEELEPDVLSIVQSLPLIRDNRIDLLQVLESLAAECGQGCGHGLCWRIIAVVKAAKMLGLTFSEAFEKPPVELLQLLSLKAQDSLEEAKLLVQTHVMSPPSIARILAESFLKGLLAAHRGGYMDSQREEGPAPLLWRFSDFLIWAELCPSEPEIGHALMRLIMTGQEIPHACEVELLILSHHFYKSSSCLDGVDVLVTLAANRVESYVSEGDFSCLARLITGVSNFHALNFILNILIENGQLDLLLQKYSASDTGASTTEAVRGFRMSVLTSLKLFNPHDLDAFAMVYHHFDMKHETAFLLESRSMQYVHQWLARRYRDRQTEDLLEAMRYIIEAAEVYRSVDAGHKTYRSCARASLLSLQIRIPDLTWLELTETNARRALVEQSRFQEALIVAEAYDLNQPSEWAPVLWNLMLKPDLIEEFVAEFVTVLTLQPSMLLELARFYRAEVAARGDQSHFSVWLSPGGLPAEWVKHLGRSFRILLKRTRDLRVRLQLATIATGFGDVLDSCMKVLDKVPETAGPLILRRGHGGAYLPLM